VKPATLKIALFVMFVMTLVIVPFLLFGERLESSVQPWLEAREHQAGLLTLAAIVLLAADSVAPVPATVVIMFLAWKAGWLAGIVGGTLGMSAGVLTAAWFGRTAVGRLAPKFIPDAELARIRESLQRRLILTLACLRSIPVLAETSVIVAAATGVPVKRIFLVTILPNFLISVIYSAAAASSGSAKESGATAAAAFVATLVVSYAVWRIAARRRPGPLNAHAGEQ
jgi:uncharacterized membrane protein YdjX (TVP38/TMEM64 family)